MPLALNTAPRRVCASCASDFVKRWQHEGAHWPGDEVWGIGLCDVCGCGNRCVTAPDVFGGREDLWEGTAT